jgi:hypothetical protein
MRVAAACLLALSLSACRDARQPRGSDSVAAPAPAAATPRATRPGIRFDPATLAPGTAVGALVADSVSARRTVVDSTYVGTARFRGTLELSGSTLRHPDADLRGVASCFEADSSSAARMPRWAGDERRPWFCFVNRAEATRALGPPSEGVAATVVVERFTIHRGLSDEVNEALFVRRVY